MSTPETPPMQALTSEVELAVRIARFQLSALRIAVLSGETYDEANVHGVLVDLAGAAFAAGASSRNDRTGERY